MKKKFNLKNVFNMLRKGIIMLLLAFFAVPMSMVLELFTNKEELTVYADNIKYEYTYTGTYQVFEAPKSGLYKVQLWGAQGGSSLVDSSLRASTGGFGAYTTGMIDLEKGQKFYVYVGGAGTNACKSCVVAGGWNGGGSGNYDHSDDEASGGGGGATDIRLVPTSSSNVWNEWDSLASRIMVAGGGGGSSEGVRGGAGGALVAHNTTHATGASQTSGNAFGKGADGVYRYSNKDEAGGGGGYYGGRVMSSSSDYYGEGGGGTSFISGFNGSDAISFVSTASSIIHTGQSNHFSGFIFEMGAMFDGRGYQVNADGDLVTYTQMPTPTGDKFAAGTGKTGHGYAVIEYMEQVDSSDYENYKYGLGITYGYSYTGQYQKFIAPYSGYYRLEAWGAAGGYGMRNSSLTYHGGYGAYSAGTIHLNKDDVIYIYVGQIGYNGRANCKYCGGYGGWNGGAKGGDDSNHDSQPDEGGGGGGATDFRLVPTSSLTAWNEFESLKSRILIAGGGGGGVYGGYGFAGGVNLNNNGYAFGYGQTGYTATSGSGGGGGGYWGGNSPQCDGCQGYGGTSYISGHSGSLAVTAGSIASSISLGTDSVHNSGQVFSDTVMLNGNQSMPTSNGGTMTGNSGNGYAKISVLSIDESEPRLASLNVDQGTFNQGFNQEIFEYDVDVASEKVKTQITATPTKPEYTIFRGLGEITLKAGLTVHHVGVISETGQIAIYRLNIYRPPSSYPYLENITVDGDPIPGFNPSTLVYEVNLPDTTEEVDLDAVLGRPSQTVSGLGKVEVGFGTTTHIIDVVSEDGNTITSYTINFKKANTTKLKSLKLENYILDPLFDSDTYNYKVSVPQAVLSLDVEAIPLDSGSTVKIKGNGYLRTGVNNIITITVSQPGLPDSVYTVEVEREGIVPNPVFEYTCTQAVQQFEAPGTGYYKLEAWGAQGGYGHTHYSYKNRGGYGGYTTGTLWLNKGDIIYVTVGCQGKNAAADGRFNGGPGGYNGGARGGNDSNHDSLPDAGGGGGGATDFRLVGGTNTSFDSLKTRILVAGGGAGGTFGTIGQPGNLYTNTTKGYSLLNGQTGYAATSGSGGGGGGYFGGVSTQCDGCQGFGGTSYVYGYEGYLNLSQSATSTNLGLTTDLNPNMVINGRAVELSDVEVYNGNQSMPSKTSGYSVGSSGNGFARITLLPMPSENNFLEQLTLTVDGEVRTYTPTLNREDLDYYLTVNDDETRVHIAARPEDSTAKIEGLGEVMVPAGGYDDEGNIFEVKVTAENGDVRIYKVHIARAPNDNPYPLDIIVNGLVPSLCSVESQYDLCHLSPADFDKDVHDYYLTVPGRIKQLWFYVEKGHDYQDVFGDGKVSLQGGDNTITITVTSEQGVVDGTGQPSSVYRYHVLRDMTGNTDLKYFNILDSGPKNAKNPDGTDKKDEEGNVIIEYGYDLNFDPDVLEYYITIPNSYEDYLDLATNARDTSVSDKLQMYIETEDENATYEIIPANPANFETGMNDLEVKVTAANGEERSYILHIYREQNANTYISGLEVKNGSTSYTITPGFNKANLGPYLVTVPNDIDNVDIIATPEVSTTTISGDGNKTLKTGVNKFTLTATAENGTKENYQVHITREKNSNANLSNIVVSNDGTTYALDPTFDKDTLTYNVQLVQGIKNVTITATPEVSTTTYKLLDNNTIKVGLNVKRVMAIAEDGTTKTYTLNITRPASSNNYLSDIQLSTGTLDPAFNRDGIGKIDGDGNNIGFEVIVENEVTNITVTGIKEDQLATVKGNGKYSLSVGNNEITLRVIAEDGSERIYLLNVIRKPNANPYLGSLTTSVGTLNPSKVDRDTLNYTVNIESIVDSIKINATPEVKTTSVNGVAGGLKNYTINNIPVGTSTFAMTTLAEDGVSTLTYVLTIVKDKSDNVNASSIRVKEGSLDPTFAKDIVEYYVYVPNSVTTANFIVTPEYPLATYELIVDGSSGLTVSGDAVSGLVEGDNIVTVRIKGETGDPDNYKDYTVIVVRQDPSLYSDYLATLTVNPGTLNPVFNKDTMYYEVEVPYEASTVVVSATAEEPKSTITGTGTYSLKVGENFATVMLMTPDYLTREYTIKIVRKPSTETRLSALTISNGSISPTFNKDTTSYTVTTSETALKFSKIVPLDSDATYEVLNNSFQTGDIGHIVTIRVTAPDGIATRDYNLTIIKEKSNNNNLADLGVVDYAISPSFNKITTLYRVTVPNDVNTVAIYATPEDPAATVTGVGSFNVNVGENQFVVEVTSENGTKKGYTILVTKEGKGDNNLTNLIVNNGSMSPVFNSDTTSYNVEVDYTETSLDLTVILSDPNASYKVESNVLKEGANIVKVIVSAENGDKKTYTLNVTRKPIVSALLKNLKAKNYELSPQFNSNVMNYDILIDNEVTQLDLTIVPLDKNATWVVTGNENLQVGDNTITIEVTASDGVTKATYTLNVTRQAYSNTFLDYLYTSEGDVTPSFNKTTMEYSIDVPNNVTQIELFCETVDKSATMTGCSYTKMVDGVEVAVPVINQLQTGPNKIPITVVTTSGIKRTYYVTVNRAKNEANKLLTLKVHRGSTTYTMNPTFDPDVNAYTVSVPVGTPSVTISATADSTVTITGAGDKKLVAGPNVFNVVATSESGVSNIYVITVNREVSTNAFLTDLEPSVGTLEPEFTYNGTNYTLNLDSSAALLSFKYNTEDSNATVTGCESQVVPDGTSTRTITVTAEDGVTTRTYTITVIKERTDNAKLMSLSVTGYPFLETFDPDVLDYHIVVPNSKAVLLQSEVIAIPADKNAKVVKSPNLTLNTGENEFTVKVTAPDGFTTQTYTIHINREPSSDFAVTSIRVNRGYLTSAFNKNTYVYEWKIPKGIDIVTQEMVEVITSNKNAVVVKTPYVDMTDPNSDKIFYVRVSAEDGSGFVDYELHISYDLSTVATLGSLEIDKGFYVPEFKPNILVYDAYEYVDVDEVIVTATPESEFATVTSGNGPVTLTGELTIHTITVESESGATETYTLRIHKTILTDEGLVDLGLNGLENLDCIDGRCLMQPPFNTDQLEYTIKVPYEYENLDVYYQKMNEQQTVKLKIGDEYIESYTLPLGKTELFVEVYDGMNKLTRVYKVNIERCKSNNNYLKELSVKGFDFTEPFRKDIMEYTINVPLSVDEIPLEDIIAIPEDPNAVLGKINGYNYLLPGENDITIPVYAPDGSERIYIIHVIKASEYDSYLKNITVSTGIFWDLTPKFKQTIYDYTTVVDSMYSKATVEAVPVSQFTKVEGTGEYELKTGVNVVTLTAYATDENGVVVLNAKGEPASKSVYTVTIIKKESTDVDLINLIVKEGTLLKADTLQPGFDRTITKYAVNVPSNVDKATIIATASDPTSTIKILGNDHLKVGPNNVSVIVYNNTKTASKTYQITINREADTNNALGGLKVYDDTKVYPLTPPYSESVTYYNVEVPHDVDKVTIEATPKSPNATVTGDGLIYLDYGINKKTVTIISESGDAKIHTVEIYRNYNLNLQTLVSDVGTLVQAGTDPAVEGFSPEVVNYVINVDKDTDRIVFIAIPESNKVTAYGSGEYNLAPGENTIEFRVVSPDNHEKVYKVVVNREKDDNNYIAELIVNGIMNPVFNKETGHYEVNIRHTIINDETPVEVTKLGIQKVKLESANASCVITGPAEIVALVATDNDCTIQTSGTLAAIDQKSEVKIKVTAQSGAEREYVLDVYRRDDSYFSNRLTSLKLSTDIGGTNTNIKYNPDFDPNINNYAATVVNSITSVNLEFVREDQRSTYEIFDNGVSYGLYYNNLPLNPGRNVITIAVTSEDGLSTNNYSIIVYRVESSDATLRYLETTGFNYLPMFGKETTEYTLSVSGTVTSIPIVALPTDPNASVTITGNTLLQPGENIINIHVVAPDGVTTKDYKITVTKALSINDFLTMLEVVDYPFDRPFNKNDYGPYAVNVPSNVTNILIKAIAEDPKATITGDGNKTLVTGENIFPVDVEAEDPDYTRTYTIVVNKAASSDSTLKDIILSDGTLDPIFNPGILTYEVLVPEELEEITITGIPNDPTSTVAGNDTYAITDLETEISLVVTSEDGNKTTYKVKVIRDVQSISTLKTLIVKSGELYPRFHKLITSYTVLVPNEVRSFSMDSEPFNMIYEPEDPQATVVVTGNTNFRVGANKVKIAVTSRDGSSTTTYEISVIRQAIASNYLRSLEVKSTDETINYTMTPSFVKDTLYYEVTVPMEVDTVKLKATLEDFSSTVSGTGTKHLDPGENRFYVTVESAGGIIRSYQIVINRTESNENYLLTLTHDVGTIDPAFDKEVNNYTITVPEKTTQITLDGTVSENSTCVGLGTFPIVVGEQTKTIIVTSQGGDINVYNIKIVRPGSNNTRLNSLVPSAGVLKYDNSGVETEGYTNDATDYTIVVNDSVSVISFTADPEDPDATISGLQLTTLNYSENEVNITVTAEDGVTTRDITIKIIKTKGLIAINASEESVLIGVGEDITISYTLDPADATDAEVVWVSGDPTIATVDQDGKIVGVKLGTAQVLVKSAADSNVYDTVIVKIINKTILSDVYQINRFESETGNLEENTGELDGVVEKVSHVIGLEPATTLSDFIANFLNDPETLHVYDASGNELTDPDEFIASYMTIKLAIEDKVFDELAIVVRGDINGDAFIDVTDYDMMNQYLLTLANFNYLETCAADVEADEFITVSDYDKLNQYLLLMLNTVN